ncbi:MAG: hypothetical protein IKV59_06275 [Lachnospiraceae bacterium]|nr:hypothetical protein [Lachnospiraceae bacterium]
MKVKCEYCGNFIPDTEELCPACGAPNEHMVRSGEGIPKTIEELKEYAVSRELPLEQMRFFIGEDIREPKAFGIYEDAGGIFIVYKNKANGERAIRYRGSDEAYAVNELYQKLRSEVTDQKAKIAAGEAKPKKQENKQKRSGSKIKTLLIVIALILFQIIATAKLPDKGYYLYQDTYYYTNDLGDTWYQYDAPADDWFAISGVDEELYDNWKKYKLADPEPNDTQTVQTTQTDQIIYYPYIRSSDYWDKDDMDTLDSYEDDINEDGINDSDTIKDADTWNDDWDDDDLDWDNDYDWDDSSTDWDSDW